MTLKLEKLVNEIDNRFARLKDRIEEFTLNFGRIYDHLNVLYKIVYSNE